VTTVDGVLSVIQARTGSTRLPGKVLLPLGRRPVLARMVERVRLAALSGTVVVATTTHPADDAIEALCAEEGVACFRGDALDLLDRHVQAARRFDAVHVVKIPSDCPLIDPEVIDRVIGTYLSRPGAWDYVSNLHPATWPDGNDVEVMPRSALETAWAEATRPYEREHTTPFLWDQPDRFRIGNVVWEEGPDLSMLVRLTLDWPEDYEVIRTLFEAAYPDNPRFGLREILQLLQVWPDLGRMNAHLRGVNWYRHHLDDLRTVEAAETRPMVQP
jgi:spore coat polysaccharide biosynthesis protein SpsF